MLVDYVGESSRGTYAFDAPSNDKKTVGIYLKEHMKHLFAEGFLNRWSGLGYGWFHSYVEGRGGHPDSMYTELPEALVEQIQAVQDNWDESREYIEEGTDEQYEKFMTDLLSALSPEEFYDVLVNNYVMADGGLKYKGGIFEEDDDELSVSSGDSQCMEGIADADED